MEKLINVLKRNVPQFAPELHSIEAQYSGCGDSGDIEEVIYKDKEGKGIIVPDNLDKLVLQGLWELLKDEHGGWEINDGANGSFYIDLEEGKITNQHNEAFTDYNSSTNEWSL